MGLLTFFRVLGGADDRESVYDKALRNEECGACGRARIYAWGPMFEDKRGYIIFRGKCRDCWTWSKWRLQIKDGNVLIGRR